MKTLLETLRHEVRPDIIFSTAHNRLRELNETLPHHRGEIFLLSAKPEQIEDLIVIMLFSEKLTLFRHPLYDKVDQACTWVLKKNMHAIHYEQRLMAARLADIVMNPPTKGRTIGLSAA
ncbi:hypothetical protein ACQQ2Q_04785 [Agrobacterium sp. ES01]|uniref:hypothetical protein n=1 Tax=Agrobacterium sp. ES01 TaxID=3420714 RepID=UPI003D0E6580